jgi:exodeoxyribonuclease VII small subunit
VSRASDPKPTPGEAPEAYDLLVARLEKVVGELEGPGLGLEQSLEKFAEGMRLAREAQKKLDEAERRIERLVRSADGADEAVPLDDGGEPAGGSR